MRLPKTIAAATATAGTLDFLSVFLCAARGPFGQRFGGPTGAAAAILIALLAQSEDPHERRASGGMDMPWPPPRTEPAPAPRPPPREDGETAQTAGKAPLPEAGQHAPGATPRATTKPPPVIPAKRSTEPGMTG